ncbi:MAG: hypothetical protein AAF645_15720 [Myxococcota bacterium]
MNDAHASICRAEVRGRPVRQCAAVTLLRGDVRFIATAIGPPRAWAYALDAVVAGFRESIATASGASPGDALEKAIVSARGRLVDACNALVERESPDAHICGLWILPRRLYIAGAGTNRVYRHRGVRPERITPRHQSGGVLQSPLHASDVELDTGDVLLAGSESAFSTISVASVATVLQESPPPKATVLASLMTDPARKAGAGAAALAIRVR